MSCSLKARQKKTVFKASRAFNTNNTIDMQHSLEVIYSYIAAPTVKFSNLSYYARKREHIEIDRVGKRSLNRFT